MKQSVINFRIAIAMTALCIASTIKSQSQSFEIGARAMPTFSSFSANTSSGGTVNGEVTLGYGVGALVAFNFSDYVGVQVEGIYTTISQKYVEQDVEHKVKLKYFNIPMLLSLNTGKSKAVNFNMVAGPQLGISAGSTLDTQVNNNAQSNQAVLSVKKGDLGFAYGAGLDFGINPLQTLRLGIGFRGVYGLFDISDDSRTLSNDSYYLLDRTHIKTYSGYVGVSFMF